MDASQDEIAGRARGVSAGDALTPNAAAADMRRDLRPYRLVPHAAMVYGGAGSERAR